MNRKTISMLIVLCFIVSGCKIKHKMPEMDTANAESNIVHTMGIGETKPKETIEQVANEDNAKQEETTEESTTNTLPPVKQFQSDSGTTLPPLPVDSFDIEETKDNVPNKDQSTKNGNEEDRASSDADQNTDITSEPTENLEINDSEEGNPEMDDLPSLDEEEFE